MKFRPCFDPSSLCGAPLGPRTPTKPGVIEARHIRTHHHANTRALEPLVVTKMAKSEIEELN